ncbi:hypothetical protein C9439_05565 [archaeon SCG-AAA382B04]|nr:hypothetical protein C9439_05565 [archaeon SCG-AAA382B04]
MTEFERGLVNSLNKFFEKNDIQAIAYRRKQHRFSSQFIDVLVDSLDPDYYLAIENKSISTRKGAKKLYFSQHFSENQINNITDFLNRSGRTGYLAVELKRGRGKSRLAFMIKWEDVINKLEKNEVGFKLNEIKRFPRIERCGEEYDVSSFLD